MPFACQEHDAQACSGCARRIGNREAEGTVFIRLARKENFVGLQVLDLDLSVVDALGSAVAAFDDDIASLHVGENVDSVSHGRVGNQGGEKQGEQNGTHGIFLLGDQAKRRSSGLTLARKDTASTVTTPSAIMTGM